MAPNTLWRHNPCDVKEKKQITVRLVLTVMVKSHPIAQISHVIDHEHWYRTVKPNKMDQD